MDIKGISKEFEWKITKETINEKLFFTINGELNRLDFGVGEKSFLISNQLKIAIKISII